MAVVEVVEIRGAAVGENFAVGKQSQLPSPAGGRAKRTCARRSTPFFICCTPAARGAIFPAMDFRRVRPSTIFSAISRRTACAYKTATERRWWSKLRDLPGFSLGLPNRLASYDNWLSRRNCKTPHYLSCRNGKHASAALNCAPDHLNSCKRHPGQRHRHHLLRHLRRLLFA